MYSSDFYAERAAREKIHEEKEHLATELDFTKQLNRQLQEEMESLGRYELNHTHRSIPRLTLALSLSLTNHSYVNTIYESVKTLLGLHIILNQV